MQTIFINSGSFVLVFLCGLAGGFLALRLSKSRKSAVLFSLGNAFAGGIFLGAGFIHMLPDAREGLANLLGDYDFPWSMVVCACGFILILFIEKVIMSGHHHIVIAKSGTSEYSLSPYILTFVLSIHSIIAGIALGLEDVTAKALIILIAILAHKGSAAFALGVSIKRGGINIKRSRGIITFFSFMTPLGILIGSLSLQVLTGRTEQFLTSIFDALAAGTFIYIAILEIIREEFSENKNRLLKFILLLSSLGFMALLAVWL